MRIVILNGPPNVGKDTLAYNLINFDCEAWYKASFKEILYKQTAEHYHMILSEFMKLATDRTLKEVAVAELDFKSPRQAMIHVSETIVKRDHGSDFYGVAMIDQICSLMLSHNAENIIIADGGFDAEVKVLMEAFPHQVWIVHMTSKDCDFSNDSRSYIKCYPDHTFELAISRGYPLMDLDELQNILDDIEAIEFNINQKIYDYCNEPDDTPFMTEDFEGDRTYIGEDNE